MDAAITALFDLEGKVALVTGGAKGIGQGIVETLAAAGATVAIADIDQPAAESLAKTLQQQDKTAVAIGVDMADEASVKAMVEATMDQAKRLDLLINNAGIYPMARLREQDTALWDRVLSMTAGVGRGGKRRPGPAPEVLLYR